jgi:sirohydrochlorin ferrochelatase
VRSGVRRPQAPLLTRGVPGGRPPGLICVAHGSADPRAAATVGSLLDIVRERAPGADVRVAFLGHAAPSVSSVLASFGDGPVVVLPLLLTAAYHSKVDLPAQLSGVDARIHYGPVLGPHPLLLDAAERRVASAGSFDRDSTGVVLAAAGSSDPGANATIRQVAAQWRERGGWRAVVPAYASAAPPTVAEAVAALRDVPGVRRVLVATYLIAPGQFADQILVSALEAGADAVTQALGALPEIADLILERYTATVSSLQAGAA